MKTVEITLDGNVVEDDIFFFQSQTVKMKDVIGDKEECKVCVLKIYINISVILSPFINTCGLTGKRGIIVRAPKCFLLYITHLPVHDTG